jgi:hypothetical protein
MASDFFSLFHLCPATDRHHSFKWKPQILAEHTSLKESNRLQNQLISKLLSFLRSPFYLFDKIRHIQTNIKIRDNTTIFRPEAKNPD